MVKHRSIALQIVQQLTPELFNFYGILISGLNILKGNAMTIIGEKFGFWTVIDIAGRDKKSNFLVKVKCSCGTERINRLDVLMRNESTRCRSCRSNKPDLVGQKFGKWTVLKRVYHPKQNARYLCQCECGTEKEQFAYDLRGDKVHSCAHCRLKTHGMSYTSTFRIWQGILSRCLNQKLKAYPYYGGRGIKVCESWLKFENFLADMGERPNKLSIDRINNDGDYEPSNCRWATTKEQHQNRRVTIRKGAL